MDEAMGGLLGDGTPSFALGLVDRKVASTGVIIAISEPAGAVPVGSFERTAPSAREAARQTRMQAED